MRFLLSNSRIRTKLFLAYSAAFTVLFLITGAIIHARVDSIVRESIENELNQTTETIRTLILATTDSSINNYLRAVAEKAADETRHLHQRALQGKMTEEEAKEEAKEMLLSHAIGITGSIYVLNSQGIMEIHHKRSFMGVDMSGLDFVREMISKKSGSIQYKWKAPLDTHPRSKVAHVLYFEPWDWIITAAAFRDEFEELVDITTFENRLFDLGSGESGYPFVLDYDGNMILHPFLEGKHYSEYGDPKLSAVAKRIIEEKNGHFDYEWRNPGEPKERKKVVYYRDLPELGWVVSSSSYYEDFQAPIDAIGWVIGTSLVLALLLMIPISMGIGALITQPLEGLQNNFARAAEGNFGVRMPAHSRDELGLLAGYFNSFMEKLTEYSNHLKEEIDQRKETEKKLIALDKSKSLFLASASHELRTPLTSIIGFLKLMERNFNKRFRETLKADVELEPKVEQYETNMTIVRDEANRLGRLVNDLLDLSKIEAGRMEWRDDILSVDDVLERAAQAIAAYDANNPEVALTVSGPMGHPTISADGDRIHQVLINLLSNAFKNTDSGEVALSALAGPNGIEFSVCDTGRGIRTEDQEKIFDIFYQVHNKDEHSSAVFGTGLGLSICRQIVQHYGHDLEVTSTVGKGSCFTFIIPSTKHQGERP